MIIKELKTIKTFAGKTQFIEHESSLTKTTMKFSTFIPSGEVAKNAIIWLSGLTCNEENFITKSGIQNLLQGTNTMVICPDTSPRGLNLPKEHDSYDFGSGAGFYVNATTKGYCDHYQMYDYILKEITTILKENYQVKNISIMGHSMGGHGALILGLREREAFKSVSAFSPIANPINSQWGKKAFLGYFGENALEQASKYDATEVLKLNNKTRNLILIDQGLDDEFLERELLIENFKEACQQTGQEVEINYRSGYDHSYYFISTFLKNHINFHLKALGDLKVI